ncbi:hypothetical protein [Salipiger bermudensis]|uniref:hypothetical protein n=1 Tax=Salipiger bermudensis TaxID=344736 RepID=UPI001CD43183|nr:hypothetical protein [Salipiger bermudensis]MCA0961143.1 hypothetical protein [Salipiger bermudensis]
MLLLKISYAIAFLASALSVIFAVDEGEPIFFSAAIAAFIAGSVIAGLDRIITLLTPTKETVDAAPVEPPSQPTPAPVSRAPAPDADDLDKRIAAAKSRQTA